MSRSDVIWLEAERLGGVRAHDAGLDGTAAGAVPLELIAAIPHAFRMQVLAELGWVPRFVDLKAHFPGNVAPPGMETVGSVGTAGDRPAAFGTWMREALGHILRRRRANRFPPMPGEAPSGDRAAAELADYRLVHAMVCWPFLEHRDGERSGESDLAQLAERLGFAREHGQSVSLLRMPPDLDDGAAWRLTATRRIDTAILPEAVPGSVVDTGPAGEPQRPADLGALAAGLVEAWLDVVLEAVFGD